MSLAGIGEALRSTRERRGLSIDQAAQETRISPRFLEALEAEQFQELPAPVYVRGFLRSYANYLQMEAQPLLDQLVGGGSTAPGARAGYAGGNGRNGHAARHNSDPFRRTGVVASPTVARMTKPVPPPARAVEQDAWAPEPLAPIAPPHQDHGYIPGSDLMEAPEYAQTDQEDDFEYEPYPEPQPRFERRTAGVLAERPPSEGDPGVPRKVALFGGGVVAVLAFLGLAVFATRDGGNGDNSASADNGVRTGVTPGTIISGDGATSTAASRNASPSASASAAASGTASASASASSTASTTTTPGATAAPGATTTPTPTATQAGPTNTPAPTSTPTLVPTPVPTAVPVRPENLAFGECTPTNGTYDCGPGPYRVICFTPIGYPQNSNWWVDVDRSFGALPPGWKEYDGLTGNGGIIRAGQTLCATQ